MLSPIKISPFVGRQLPISGVAPQFTANPVITAAAFKVGETLTCSDGTVTGTATITYSYQWYRGVTPIGADQNTYVAVIADEGQSITCDVTATNAYGSDVATSNAVVIELYLLTFFNDYSGRNQWAAQQSTVVSTTTTWQDYAGTHDLANPAAGNQPATTNPDSDFNNKASSTFDGTDDYLIKNTANYGAGQTSGSMWFVVKTPAAFSAIYPLFSACDAATNLAKALFYIDTSGEIRTLLNNGTVNFSIRTTSPLTVSTKYIIEIESTGLATNIYVNGVLQAVANVIGIDIGSWFAYANTLSNLDNIVIGGRINTSPLYYKGKQAYVGNFPYSAANRAAMFTKLKSYYNVIY